MRSIALACLAALCAATPLLAASPTISSLSPRGGTRGGEIEVTLTGRNMDDAQQVIFHTPGIEQVGDLVLERNRVKVKLAIAGDCRFGEHIFRLRTATGLTEMNTFWVGPFTGVDEKEDSKQNNNDLENAQIVPLNSTVQGVCTSEDIDFYGIELKKGMQLSAEVEALRLATSQNRIFDPILMVYDPQGQRIAQEDDTPLLYQDAAVTLVAPADGLYKIAIRDVTFGGDAGAAYRLHLGDFPRPTAVYPAGGVVGEKMEVTYLGDAGGPWKAQVTPSGEPNTETMLVPQGDGRTSPSGLPFRLSEAGNVLEAEPNNDRTQATAGSTGQALNGILNQAGDEDWFRFSAKKNEQFQVQCYARQLRTPGDLVVQVVNDKGRAVVSGDDDRGNLDPTLDFKAPEDGDYFVRVYDHLRRGGETYVYRIEFEKPAPLIGLTIPEFRRYSQERNAIVIPRGNRYATTMQINRRGTNETLKLIADQLPEGVKMIVPDVPRGQNTWPVLFEADEKAPLGVTLTNLRGEEVGGQASGGYEQTAMMLRVRNNQQLWGISVPRLAVAVAEAAPFRLELVQPKVPVVQNGSMQLKVRVQRNEGFDGPVYLEMPFRPTGVSTVSRVTLDKGKTEVDYPVNTSPNAPVQPWQLLIIGRAEVSGDVWASTGFIDLNVGSPMLSVAFDRATVEKGQVGRLTGKVTINEPFEGNAEVRLLGLPGDLKPTPLTMTKDTTELVFEIPTATTSRTTRHRNLFAEVTIHRHGEPIVHKVGSGELQVVDPLPKQAKAGTDGKLSQVGQ